MMKRNTNKLTINNIYIHQTLIKNILPMKRESKSKHHSLLASILMKK